MNGNANDSKHVFNRNGKVCMCKWHGLKKRKRQKKNLYVPLLVANYLHLLNANQKLEVKLFNGISSSSYSFSFIRLLLFHFIIFDACVGWFCNVSFQTLCQFDGYKHYLCICHPCTKYNFLNSLKMSPIHTYTYARAFKANAYHDYGWTCVCLCVGKQFTFSWNRIKFKWIVSVSSETNEATNERNILPNHQMMMVTMIRKTEQKQRADEHKEIRSKVSINNEKTQEKKEQQNNTTW